LNVQNFCSLLWFGTETTRLHTQLSHHSPTYSYKYIC